MKKFIIALFFFLVVTDAFILYFQRDALYAELDQLNLIPRSEAFTELYFSDTSALPQAFTARTKIAFSFTIHNEEGETTTYPYTVRLIFSDGHYISIDENTITLQSGAYATISEAYTLNMKAAKAAIVVELPLKQEYVDFFLPKSQSA